MYALANTALFRTSSAVPVGNTETDYGFWLGCWREHLIGPILFSRLFG